MGFYNLGQVPGARSTRRKNAYEERHSNLQTCCTRHKTWIGASTNATISDRNCNAATYSQFSQPSPLNNILTEVDGHFVDRPQDDGNWASSRVRRAKAHIEFFITNWRKSFLTLATGYVREPNSPKTHSQGIFCHMNTHCTKRTCVENSGKQDNENPRKGPTTSWGP